MRPKTIAVILLVVGVLGFVIYYAMQNAGSKAAGNLDTEALGRGLGQGLVTNLFDQGAKLISGQPLGTDGNK
jgi:hypothetical protein